jgi:hypothetical protein
MKTRCFFKLKLNPRSEKYKRQFIFLAADEVKKCQRRTAELKSKFTFKLKQQKQRPSDIKRTPAAAKRLAPAKMDSFSLGIFLGQP